MKLDLLDAYNIRARICPSIILLGPIGLTIFFCFEKIYTFASSAILIGILLAFTNYIPILQRSLRKKIAIRLIMQLNFLKLMIAHLTLFQRIDIIKNSLTLTIVFCFLTILLTAQNLKHVVKVQLYI